MATEQVWVGGADGGYWDTIEVPDQPSAASVVANPVNDFGFGNSAAASTSSAEPTYFAANPDVAAAYAQNSYGLTPEQFAQTHYERYGVNEQRAAPVNLGGDDGAFADFVNPLNSVDSLDNASLSQGLAGDNTSIPGTTATSYDPAFEVLYQSVLGRMPTQEELNNWGFGATVDANELDRFLGAARNEVATTAPTTGAVADLAKQILEQGTTGKWGGEGLGSAEKNAYDMAVMLAGQGLTDISQFGVREREIPAGFTQDYDGYITEVPGRTVQEYYNKVTGQAINPYYDKAAGNTWGGTFAGEGSTAYKVQFNPDGTPVFYTQYGGSSNDLANLMQDIGPVGQIGLALATGGLSIPQQIAAQMAVQVLSGKDIGDAIKSAAVNLAVAQIPGMDAMKEGASYLNSIDPTGALSKAFQTAATSGSKAALTGGDVGEAMLSGALSGGASGAVESLLSSPEFSGLSDTQKRAAGVAAAGVISGKPLDQALINAAISAARLTANGAGTSGAATSEAPLTEEEMLALGENRLNKAFSKYDIESEQEAVDARTQELLDELAGTMAPSDYEEFLRSIGITSQSDLGASPSNQDILDAFGYEGSQPTAADMGTVEVVGNRIPPDDMGEIEIVDTRPVVEDMGEVEIVGERPEPEPEIPDMGEIEIVDERPTTPGTPLPPGPPVAPPKPPVVPPAPPVVPSVKPPPEIVKTVAKMLDLPVSSPIVQDIAEALYGTMEYLDISEEFAPSKRKAQSAATQNQLQQTKMAQGGYLDDLLAEDMSADDLLNLLR